jgi:two-component system LytT family response regulator
MTAPDGLLRAVIVEDEPLNYRRLNEALSKFPGVSVVGWARTAPLALKEIRKHHPDLVFLDIEIPGMNGVELARCLKDEAIRVVFVTAHTQFAIEAFEVNAVDYLLKPFTDERVGEALSKVRRSVAGALLHSLSSQLIALGEGHESSAPHTGLAVDSKFLSRVSVDKRGKLAVIPVTDIESIHADGVYVEIQVGDERFFVREALTAMESKLDPDRFCRIHRSHIVALDSIEAYVHKADHWVVQMKSGMELPVGRSHRKELERRLGRF